MGRTDGNIILLDVASAIPAMVVGKQETGNSGKPAPSNFSFAGKPLANPIETGSAGFRYRRISSVIDPAERCYDSSKVSRVAELLRTGWTN
jgi:hypothetical protein